MGAQWERNGDAMGTQRPVSCHDAFLVRSVAFFSGAPCCFPCIAFFLRRFRWRCVAFRHIALLLNRRRVPVALSSRSLRHRFPCVVFPLICVCVRRVVIGIGVALLFNNN